MLRRWICPLLLWISVPASAVEQPKPYFTETLDNGLTVIAMESHKVPLVTIVLAAKAGAMTETPDSNGLTHLWEHMFFKGNARLPDQEAFNRRIRQLGISYNGDTAAEKVRYFFTLPSAFLQDGIQFMADAISTPLLEQKELERERRVVLNEYERNAAQPSFDYANLQRSIIYGDQQHQRDPLGLRPIIEKATRDQLLTIRDQVFVPSNCALLVAGDFTPDQLKRIVKQYFTAWKNPPAWSAVKPKPFPAFPATTNFIMTRPNVQNAHVESVFFGPKARSQPKDTYALDVLVHLLHHRSGTFYKKFVDSGLTYEASLGYYTQSQAGEIEVSATTEPKQALRVQKLLLDEIPKWARPGYFTSTQLEDVQRKMLIAQKHELNQPTEFIKEMAFWWAVTGLDYREGYLPMIAKVTLRDVQAAVAKWLVGKPHLDGILLSPEDATKVGLHDTSAALVSKFLKDYQSKDQSSGQPESPAPVSIPNPG